jgi:hypothetical protein
LCFAEFVEGTYEDQHFGPKAPALAASKIAFSAASATDRSTVTGAVLQDATKAM